MISGLGPTITGAMMAVGPFIAPGAPRIPQV